MQQLIVKPEIQNPRFEPTDLAIPSKTHVLTSMGLDLACQDTVGQGSG